MAVVQSVVYVSTGLWPLVHIDSFLLVTGPKYDLWLVQTVGVLVALIGGALAAAAWNRRITPEIALLGAGVAVALAVIDVVFVVRDVIASVYLADAAMELLFAAGWCLAPVRARSGSSGQRHEP